MIRETNTNSTDPRDVWRFARNAILSAFTMTSLIVGSAAAPIVQMSGANDRRALNSLHSGDVPLTAAEASAFVQQLIESAGSVLDDAQDLDDVEAVKSKISAAFKTRGPMTGKTKKQIVGLFMADVDAAVENQDLRTAISDAVAAMMNVDGAETNTPTTPEAPKTTGSLSDVISGLEYDVRALLGIQGDGGTALVARVKNKALQRRLGDGKVTRCARMTRSLSRNFEDIAILQPTRGVVYPGAMIFADRNLIDGTPRPLTVLARAPIALRLDLPGLQEEGRFTIADPNDGKVQSAVSKARDSWNNSANFKEGYFDPSRSNYNSAIAYSSEQLAMSLGFNADWASGATSAQLKYLSTLEKNVVVAVYRQVFYTVTFDAPSAPEQLFDPKVTADEAREAFTSENRSAPAYVSSVSYGRMIMFRMETELPTTAEDSLAAFNHAAGKSAASAELQDRYNKIIGNSSITAVTFGGNSEVASENVSATGAVDLQRIITGKVAAYSKNNPGVPIAYRVRLLKDNSVAKTGSAIDYNSEECREFQNTWVKLVQTGAYVAHFYADWEEPDSNNPEQMIKKSLKEEGVLAGNRKIFNFPGDAQNIRLKIENDTGVVWQPRRVIIDRVLDRKDLNKCYQVVGTALNSSFDNNCQ